jgi:ribose 5-phosphate isomerase B
MRIYFAADHAGFELKKELMEFARGLGHEVEDRGAFEMNTEDDYPQFVAEAARKLAADAAAGLDSRAVVLGASGQGEAMVANRFKGVRCALYYGSASRTQVDASGKELDLLTSTRWHNNANALSLGARFLSIDEAKDALSKWLSAGFSAAEPHIRRTKQIDEV